MKVVINVCHGGFSLSPAAVEKYLERKGKRTWWFAYQRKENGGPDFDAPLVPAEPDNKIFGPHAYTSSEPNEDAAFWDREIKRDDLDLVEVVEELGAEADGALAKLSVVDVPDGVEWEIEEYDGLEWVAEAHRVWS